MRDVARTAGVSPMTVSNVVNGRFGAMAEETRRRVEAAIQNMNYRPNARGRELRLSRNFTIGIVIIDPTTSFLAAPFTTQLVAGLSNYLSEHNYRLLIQGIRPEHFKSALALRSNGIDGLCVLMSGTAAQRQSFRRIIEALGQPTVMFQEFETEPGADICCICQQDFEGGHMIASHVLAKGARHLLALDVRHEWPALSERLRGVRAATTSTPGATLDIVTCESSALTHVELALRRHLENHAMPDAILGSNDQMGLGAMHFLLRQNRDVPDEIMVTGFNAFGFQLYAPIALTSVRSPAYEMGARGGAELLNRLANGRFAQRRIDLQVALDYGDSA